MTDTQDDARYLTTDLVGLQLASPIVLLSGCVGFGEEYTRVEGFSNRDVGAVCLKGTTLNPRLGNEPHRPLMALLNHALQFPFQLADENLVS